MVLNPPERDVELMTRRERAFVSAMRTANLPLGPDRRRVVAVDDVQAVTAARFPWARTT